MAYPSRPCFLFFLRRPVLSWLALLLVGTTLLGSLWHLHRTGQLLYPGRCASASDDPARSGAEAEADANPNLSKLGMPVIFDELAAAPPLDTWRTPVVSLERGGTALMFLHIFSSISPEARAKRELIRDLTILQHVNERYRHLIDIKFVIGYPDPEKMALAENEGEMTEENGQGQDREDGEREPPFDRQAVLLEEAAIEREMRRYGDVIRLEGLLHGENMNEGKSWEWIRWVGNHSPREAQWVFKCDDDTLPILPALLTLLVSLDPAQPTFVGSAMGVWNGFHYYFQGLLYGMSWNVVKTIAAADVPKKHIWYNYHEDARIGGLMWSLPSSSDCTFKHPFTDLCDARTPPPGGVLIVPESPDPRTGLIRVDLHERLGDYGMWWIAKVDRAVAWHRMKTAERYLEAWAEVDEHIKKRYGAKGWVPPPRLNYLAATLGAETGSTIRRDNRTLLEPVA